MHKGPKCIQTLCDHQKKIPFVEKYKECAICAILRENKTHFGAYPEAKKGVARAQVRYNYSPEAPKKCKSLWGCQKKTFIL